MAPPSALPPRRKLSSRAQFRATNRRPELRYPSRINRPTPDDSLSAAGKDSSPAPKAIRPRHSYPQYGRSFTRPPDTIERPQARFEKGEGSRPPAATRIPFLSSASIRPRRRAAPAPSHIHWRQPAPITVTRYLSWTNIHCRHADNFRFAEKSLDFPSLIHYK